MSLSHGALNHRVAENTDGAIATVLLTRPELSQVVVSGKTFLEAFDDGMIPWEGDGDRLRELFSCLDSFEPMFNIVEP